MKVVVVVKPGRGGGGVSQAARYISRRGRDESREGPEARQLFSDADDGLGFHRANRFLGGGREPVTSDVLHLVISFHREEDFIRLGADEGARQRAVRRITRETVREMTTSLRAGGLRWVAGIHHNTDNPHVHLLIHRDFFDRETGRAKRLENLPKEMRVSWGRAEDGTRVINQGALSQAFEKLLDQNLERAGAGHDREESDRGGEKIVTSRGAVARWRGTHHLGAAGEKANSDLRLMELAALNPSLGGRELMKEIIERGPAPEETERQRARDIRAALRVPGLDDPEYRTAAEHADWLGAESRGMRDLYERGAEIKGDILVIPAEEHELPEDREPPFITTLAYAQERFNDVELASEFHRLALVIGGETADERTRIEVFKTYYERITPGGRGNRFGRGREAGGDEVLARTLGEMRTIAAEMAGLETLESVEAKVTILASDMRGESAPPAFPGEELSGSEEREDEPVTGKANVASRRVRLGDESLRLPAGLDYETKVGLVSRTIPEIDRRLESGVSREALFRAIDSKMYRPDPAAYLSKLAELAGTPKDDDPRRPLSSEGQVESRKSLLKLCEEYRQRVLGLEAAREDEGRDLHEGTRLARVESLIARLKRELSGGGLMLPKEQARASRLYVSLQGGGAAGDAFRLPVSSVRVFEAMAKAAAGANLSLRTWDGRDGREVRLGLTGHEEEMRGRVASFLKNYIDERLRDPEARALNDSAGFREARRAIIGSSTPEDLGRIAASFLRVNVRRSEEWRRHLANPVRYQPPAVLPLGTRERNLLFFGRAPDHHTREMRELRINYGLSRAERAAQIIGLREGSSEMSDTLRAMLRELKGRRTAKAIAHFEAGVINEKVSSASSMNLYQLSQRIPPHERTYLYEMAEKWKRDLLRSSQAVLAEAEVAVERTAGRPVGTEPPESRPLRECLASAASTERKLLNEALRARTLDVDRPSHRREPGDLTNCEAHSLLPEETRKEIRPLAQNLTRDIPAPGELCEQSPSQEVMRVGETSANIHEHLQERARVAQAARDDFVAEHVRLAEGKLREGKGEAAPLFATQIDREQFVRSVIDSLGPADARRLAELGRYVVRTREDINQAFENLDMRRHELEVVRGQAGPSLAERQGAPHELRSGSADLRFLAEARLAEAQVAAPPRAAGAEEFNRREAEAGRHNSTGRSCRNDHVDTDHEWHFDSLSTVLKFDRSMPDEPTREHDHYSGLDRDTYSSPER